MLKKQTKLLDSEQFQFANGRARIHTKGDCKGPCPIHSPSEHHMREWKMVLRETLLIERLCPHGVGHPDPDSLKFLDPKGDKCLAIHGCCGHCDPNYVEK